MPTAQRGSRLRFAGNDEPPMIQMAWPSQWYHTGDSRGPCSELCARWAYNGLDKNSSRSKTSRSQADTLFSMILIAAPCVPAADAQVRLGGASGSVISRVLAL